MSRYHSSTKPIQPMFDLLNTQSFHLKIDLVQTAFPCEDCLTVHRLIDFTRLLLAVTKCETSHNASILLLIIALPAHEISVQLTLSRSRTVEAVRLGLTGLSASSSNGSTVDYNTIISTMLLNTYFFCVLLLIITPTFTTGICKWYGIAPFCFLGNSCPDGCFKTAESEKGDGAKCWFSQKNFCCCPKRALDALVNSIVSDDKK
ncbi:unnamed protein product [Rotaria sp. Silwood2]|nr:unnamed protein product [Rotaria sp. Silwood2]